jgi:hypothetical protein
MPQRAEKTGQGNPVHMSAWVAGEGPMSYRSCLPIGAAVRADNVRGEAAAACAVVTQRVARASTARQQFVASALLGRSIVIEGFLAQLL